MSQKKKEQKLLEHQQNTIRKHKSKHRHSCCGRCKNCKCNNADK